MTDERRRHPAVTPRWAATSSARHKAGTLPTASAHRAAIFRSLLKITILITGFFTIWNFLVPDYFLSATECCVCGFNILLLCWMREKNDPGRHTLYFIIPLAILILFACLRSTHPGILMFWVLVVPTVAYVLLGHKDGLKLSAVYIVATVAVIAYRFSAGRTDIMLSTLVNLVACLVCVTVLAHVYEIIRARAEAELRDSALHDSLTGVLNRTGIQLAFDGYISGSGQCATLLSAIVLDLDHFKSINDNYGHQAGDEVLCMVADCVKAEIGAGDAVGRLGGEEFMVLLCHETTEQAMAVAENIRQAIFKGRCRYRSKTIRVTATLGIAELTKQDSLDTLIEKADARLYQGKLNDRNQVVA